MTTAPPEAHLIVPDRDRQRLLFVDGALPVVDGRRVVDDARDAGLDVAVVRTQARDGDTRVIAAELLQPAAGLPAGAQWVALTSAVGAPRYAAAIEEWIAEEVDGDVPPRAPWSRYGWLDGMLAWLDEVLAGSGARRAGPIRQLKHWGLSAVVRVPTTRGDVVCKQVPRLLAPEGPTTAYLDRLEPGSVPRVLAVDGDRFVMDAFEVEDRPVDPDGLVALGALQRRVAAHVDELVAAGCPDRRASLRAEVVALLHRDDLLYERGWSLASTDTRRPPRPVEPDDVARLASVGDELDRDLADLASAAPPSIVHGDFHAHNVVWSRGRCLLFDWSNAAVAHPWLDLPMWDLRSNNGALARDAYLAQFGDATIYGRTRYVASLYHAVMCGRLADAMIDPTQAVDWAAAVQKLLLNALDDLVRSHP